MSEAGNSDHTSKNFPPVTGGHNQLRGRLARHIVQKFLPKLAIMTILVLAKRSRQSFLYCNQDPLSGEFLLSHQSLGGLNFHFH